MNIIKEIVMCLFVIFFLISKGYAENSGKFLIDVDPRIISTSPGDTHRAMVIKKSYGGWQNSIYLNVSGVPDGVTVIFDTDDRDDQAALSKNEKSVPIKISTNKSLPSGLYRFFILARRKSEKDGHLVIGVPIQLYVFKKNKERTVIPVSVTDEKIRGVIFDDRNDNDRIDSGEPVSGAVVKIAETEMETKTDIAGYFFILNPQKRKINEVQLEVTLK